MFTSESKDSSPIYLFSLEELKSQLRDDESLASSVEMFSFTSKPMEPLKVFGDDGQVLKVLVAVPEDMQRDPKWTLDLGGRLAKALKKGSYHFEGEQSESVKKQLALGWGLSQYKFDLFEDSKEEQFVPELVVGDLEESVQSELESLYMARDMVNTPANLMNPEHIDKIVAELSEEFDGELSVVRGDQLVTENFPAIYEVGKGSSIAPRLIELNWGSKDHPKLCLVGKGVCFDSGGYDLKPSSGMRNMKKDMGGAAIAISLARLVMKHELPVHLKLLIPAVENMVSGNAFKPGDVIATRKGSFVEIDNTDAEGRLVLCDALTYAAETEPDFILDFATLTGACRVALGQDLPGLFSSNPKLAREIQDLSFESADPVWAMPLYRPYNSLLGSKLASMQNSANSPFGGAITAALYLDHFRSDSAADWVHIDVFAWSLETRSYLESGMADAQSLVSMFEYLKTRYPS